MGKDNEGVLVSNDGGVYFIPNDQLAQFKLTDEAAASVTDAVGGDDVAGFAMKSSDEAKMGKIRPVKFAFAGEFKPRVLQVGYADDPI